MNFESLILLLWSISLILLILSYIKFNYISTLDFFVVSGWFFTFFRPLYTDSCNVNVNLYYWDENYYLFGTTLGAISLILFQAGHTFFNKKKFSNIQFNHKLSLDKVILLKAIQKLILFLIIILIVLYLIFGQSLFFGFNEVDAAISVAVPGLEYGFRVVGVAISILMPASIIYIYKFGPKFYPIFGLLLSISAGLIFGKRGMLVSPILIGITMCTFFSKIKLLSFKNLSKSLLSVLAILIIGFYMIFGKVLKDLPNLDFQNLDIGCIVIQVGMQEFDLLWPAIIDVSNRFNNVLDLPIALISGLIYNHADRMKLPLGSFHSITDKTMLIYNHDPYVYQKFGISPNTYQFYYSYFGLFSLVIIFFLGIFLRRLELDIFRKIANYKIYSAIFIHLMITMLLSPFDITLKYYLLDFCILFLFAIRFPIVKFNK